MQYNVKLYTIFLIFIFFVFVVIAAKFKVKSKIKVKQNSTLQILNAETNIFSARMLSEVVKNNPKQSVVISGFLAMTPLAQLVFASEGATHEELLKTIGLPNDNFVSKLIKGTEPNSKIIGQKLRSAIQYLLTLKTKTVFSLKNKNEKSFQNMVSMTSRVFVGTKQVLNETFQNILRELFDSDVTTVDFSKSQQASDMINTWVENQTNYHIKDMVSSNNFVNTTRIVIINAIYFKKKWANPFDTFYTLKRKFYVSRRQTVKLPTMYRKGEHLYGVSNELNAQLLRLPYEGNEISMLIILPKKNNGLIALLEKLKNLGVLTKAIKSMRIYEVDVFIPKFKIETTINTKVIYKQLGVTRIFSPKMSEITFRTHRDKHRKQNNHVLYVSIATQKAFIEVCEEGADTVKIKIQPGMMPVAPHYVKPQALFKADRPFFFAIQANSTTIVSGVVQTITDHPTFAETS